MTEPEIVVTDEGAHGTYHIAVEGSTVPARLTWHARGDVRVASHTFTPPAARGHGIAAKLVKAMVADAREQGFRIVPQCSYVAVLFDRYPDWADLRA